MQSEFDSFKSWIIPSLSLEYRPDLAIIFFICTGQEYYHLPTSRVPTTGFSPYLPPHQVNFFKGKYQGISEALGRYSYIN